MVKVSNVILMEILILDNLKKVKPMEKVFTHGLMAKFMTVSGFLGSNKVTEFGKVLELTLILENGMHLRLMASEFILGLMVIAMKASGTCA